jgi:hypothetical protein
MDAKGLGFFLGILLVIVVGIGIALSSIRPPTGGTPYAEFRQHRLLWNQHKPAAYRVKIKLGSAWKAWNGSARVSPDGRVEFIVDGMLVNSTPFGPYRDREYFVQTVDDVFELLDAGYTTKAQRILVEFDEKLHFPTHVSFSRDGAIDGGWQLWLSELEPS